MPNYRRHLPHWQPDGAEFFVTWRLYGSLPGERSIGPHWMQDPRVADCVMETLIESEQQWKLCRLSAWVVMPNHVHALLRPSEKLSKVLLVIKSASARRANRLLERCGQRFWQDESFDHWVRTGGSAGELALVQRLTDPSCPVGKAHGLSPFLVTGHGPVPQPNIFRARSWTCPTSPSTTNPCGLHRAAARSLTKPLAMLISGMPHADATCPPAESYPT
jgi:hypothetical protein